MNEIGAVLYGTRVGFRIEFLRLTYFLSLKTVLLEEHNCVDLKTLDLETL